jgi:hypothetical protein
VFLNRQTAIAHQCVFAAIEEIVMEDTGCRLQWRHIYAAHENESHGFILQWVGDQHGGQAKGMFHDFLRTSVERLHFQLGLGLHLQSISQQFPEKYDLHETHRLLVSLTPYDHLHRIFRLCTIHVKRNIRKLSVSEGVKKLMCSLMCVSHEDWDGTIAAIIAQGGKQAIGTYII